MRESMAVRCGKIKSVCVAPNAAASRGAAEAARSRRAPKTERSLAIMAPMAWDASRR
jgi:hypothetical protein